MYKMKGNIPSQSALLLSIYFATGACVILFINPTIRTPGDTKAKNYKKTKQNKTKNQTNKQ